MTNSVNNLFITINKEWHAFTESNLYEYIIERTANLFVDKINISVGRNIMNGAYS